MADRGTHGRPQPRRHSPLSEDDGEGPGRYAGRAGKLAHVESVREVTARGRGQWYRAYDMELATRTTTWTGSSGAHARTLHAYELRCPDPAVGSRYFTTDAERQVFIGRSFTDVAIQIDQRTGASLSGLNSRYRPLPRSMHQKSL